MCCFEFCSMFNSCNTLIAQFRLTRFGFILFTIYMMCVQIFNSMWCMDHVLFNSWTQINLDCHVLRVQACWSCIDLDRTGYHAVDAGFWIVSELVIRWIRFRFNLIDLSSLPMFVPSPWNRSQPRKLCWHKISTSRQAHSKPNKAGLTHVPNPRRASQFSWNWQSMKSC
jgi:hypothetical protein